MEGSPAEEAGIKAGDLITKVDGIEYSGEELDQASNAIKGKEGTKVKLEILSNGQTREIEVERRKIIVSHIVEKKFDSIGYLLIEDFDGGCADEFEEKYKELEKQGIDRCAVPLQHLRGFPQADVRVLPLGPGAHAKMALAGHVQGVVRQPAAVLRLKGGHLCLVPLPAPVLGLG